MITYCTTTWYNFTDFYFKHLPFNTHIVLIHYILYLSKLSRTYSKWYNEYLIVFIRLKTISRGVLSTLNSTPSIQNSTFPPPHPSSPPPFTWNNSGSVGYDLDKNIYLLFGMETYYQILYLFVLFYQLIYIFLYIYILIIFPIIYCVRVIKYM